MKFFIKTLQGKQLPIECDEDTKVRNAKTFECLFLVYDVHKKLTKNL